jgi:hypothetical protein
MLIIFHGKSLALQQALWQRKQNTSTKIATVLRSVQEEN